MSEDGAAKIIRQRALLFVKRKRIFAHKNAARVLVLYGARAAKEKEDMVLLYDFRDNEGMAIVAADHGVCFIVADEGFRLRIKFEGTAQFRRD